MKNTLLMLTAALALGLCAAFTLMPGGKAAVESKSPDDFEKFLEQFPKAELPYAITKADMQAQLEAGIRKDDDSKSAHSKSRKYLDDPNRFIPTPRMEYLSRSPIYKEPVLQLATADHHAVIYAVTQGFSVSFKTYNVAVFDKSGKYLATHSVAGSSIDHLTTGTINEQLQAVIETYTVNWEHDVYESDLADNTITGLTLEQAKTVDLTQPVENPLFEKFREKKESETKEPATGVLGAIF